MNQNVITYFIARVLVIKIIYLYLFTRLFHEDILSFIAWIAA